MPNHYLTNPNLPDQGITVHVEDGQELSQEYARSGWIDQGAPPVEEADLHVTAEPTDETPPPEQADNPLDLTKEN